MANRELRDVYQGSSMVDLFHNEPDEGKAEWLYASLTNDGVEVTKNVSYTPIVMKWFNLPPHLRGNLGAFFLIGVLPPKVSNYQAMFRPVAEMLATRQPGPKGTSLQVFDSSRQLDVDIRVVVPCFLNDVRGTPQVRTISCSKSRSDSCLFFYGRLGWVLSFVYI